MSKSKHTPGKWSVRTLDNHAQSVDYTNNNSSGTICHFKPPSCETHAKHRLHDAHLIAAAPALLEALKNMVIQYGGMADGIVEEEASNAVVQAKAIIAEAEKEE